jgi:hypothetical protein
MTVEDLVNVMDPSDPAFRVGNPVHAKLKELSKGQPFIVYIAGLNVNRVATLIQLKELLEGYPPVEITTVDGDVRKVYRLGEWPDSYLPENPLFRGRPLRTGEVCDQTLRSWAGVPLRVRQFVRIAVDMGVIQVNIDKAHDVMDIAVAPDGESRLRARYNKAVTKFEELEHTGGFPVLLISSNRTTPVGSGPFQAGRRVS